LDIPGYNALNMPALARGQQFQNVGPGISSRFFTEKRILACGYAAAVDYAIGLAWSCLRGKWLTFSDGTLRSIDVDYMWLSGKLAASGNITSIFDNSAFSAAQAALFGPRSRLHYFVYPTTFLLFAYLLA
jgi:hypothetical protein